MGELGKEENMTMTISAVILAGGMGRRMGGIDKGLQIFHGKPLFMWVYERLHQQLSDISINANRNQECYAQSGLNVFQDELEGFQGPLSGILTALRQAKTDLVLFVPCDCPFLPLNLLEKLKSAVQNSPVLSAYVYDGEREHPTFCLLSKQLADNLAQYLLAGERKMLKFMQENQVIPVDFSLEKNSFQNMNRLQDLQGLSGPIVVEKQPKFIGE